MDNHELAQRFSNLSTPLIVDACVRHKVAFRIAPPGIRPVIPGCKTAGRALPVRHYGSVDVFLEAMAGAAQGHVLVVDNGRRTDEGCVGDLTILEAIASGLAGMVVWGFHRDTPELIRIGFALFTYGTCPAGPLRLDPREPEALASARFGDFLVTGDDAVFADDDGVVFVSQQYLAQILATAQEIQNTERRQADLVQSGTTLKDQLEFDDYLQKNAADPSYTFRKHLRRIGGAIEE